MKQKTSASRIKRRIRCIAVVSAIGATTLIAGCGGGGGGAESLGSGQVDASAVSDAEAFVAKWTTRPTELSVPPLPSKPPAGKTIDYVQCGVPSCQSFAKELKAAAAAVGWTVKVLDAGFTPQTQAAAYTQAVRDNPAGVIGSGGVNPSSFAKQLAELEAKGIPVILHGIPESWKVPGVTAVGAGSSEPYFEFDGVELGNAIMADSGGRDVHIAFMGTPAVPSYNATREGIRSVLEKSCEDCTTDEFSFPVTDIGPNLPSKVVSYLRSHPEINYVAMDFLDLTNGVPAALERAGLDSKVKIVTNGISPVQIEYMKQDQLLAASVNPWPETMYYDMTIMFANSLGLDLQPYIDMELPSMLMMKSSLFPVDEDAQLFPLVEDYKQIFEEAWQVG